MTPPLIAAARDRLVDLFRHFVVQVPCPVAMLDDQFRLSLVNARWLELFGLDEQQVRSRTFFELFQQTEERWKIRQRHCLAGHIEKGDQDSLLTLDGRQVSISWELHPWRNAAGEIEGALWFCEKWTESRCMEQALRQNEERLALALKASQLGVWDWDLRTNEISWSSEVHKVVGAYPEELRFEAFCKLIHPDDYERCLLEIREAIDRNKDYRMEFRVCLPDGSVRTLLNLGHCIYDDDGHPLRLLGTVQNITVEKSRGEGLLRQQHVESVGRLAAGVAHDLNNILAPVLAGASLLRQCSPDPRDADILDLIARSAERGADIIRQLLAFGRGIEGERVPLALSSLISEVRTLLKDTFPKNIRVRCKFETSRDALLGDHGQLQQAIVNLCVNARDAMPEGGLLELKIQGEDVDEEFCKSTPEACPGSYVVLAVSDNGVGIAPSDIGRIFDPFFTTHGMSNRSGLGLSSALGIVRSHRGFLQVRSDPGQGTQIRVFLPLHQGGAIPVPVSAEVSPLLHGHGETILVVDDEHGVREILREILEGAGYRVVGASDGVEGVARYREERTRIRALVTDLLMPRMDGFRLVSELHQLDPGLPVLAMSGTLQLASSRELGGLGPVYFLPKPFTAQLVLEAVAAAVARSGAAG